jgi:hypothetical protein
VQTIRSPICVIAENRTLNSRRSRCGAQLVNNLPSHAIDSIPCATTSGMPAARAKSMSVWMGLWSPDAPANSPSVARVSGGSASAGSSSPTLTES